MDARFDIFVMGGPPQLEEVPEDEWPEAVRPRLPLEVPGFVGIEMRHDEAKAIALGLEKLGVYSLPVPVAYRAPAISVERAVEIALPHLQKLQAKFPPKKWGGIQPLEDNDPMTWFLRSTYLATSLREDDLAITVYVDKLDGHIVSEREWRRYRDQWKPNADVLLAADDLLDGSEKEQLKAVEFFAQRLPDKDSFDVLRQVAPMSAYPSVRSLARKWVPGSKK